MLAHTTYTTNENSSFEKYASKFNSLKKGGENEILPLLLNISYKRNPKVDGTLF